MVSALPLAVLAVWAGLAGNVHADAAGMQYHAAGWVQFGRVERSSDTIANAGGIDNYNKDWIQNQGGQISVTSQIGDHWEGAFGLGAVQTTLSRGSINFSNVWLPFWTSMVPEARLTYTQPLGDEPKGFQFSLGSFPYNYNPDIKDFGLYLLRGMVYPGVVLSGFEAQNVAPKTSIFGAMASLKQGGFQNDLILNSETEIRPYFDFSLADVVTYGVMPGLEVGAGINFYRFIPQNSKATSPDKSCDNSLSNYDDVENKGDNEVCYILDTLSADTAAGTAQVDTITGSMAGTKLMARLHFDPKIMFGISGPFGKQDLVLYGEAALLGIKNYPKYYSDPWQRIPVMVGFNLPAFGWLDKFSLEVEYYGSQNFNDYNKAQVENSWLPWTRAVTGQVTRNDWKWSLYASRLLMAHLRVAAQVADDHLRTGGAVLGFATGAEALVTPTDWYWMFKLVYSL